MADAVQGIRSLCLHELIGTILVSIVRADAEAAKATLEFIETVGFVPPESEAEGEEEDTQVGRLRMAELQYKKLDENDQVSEFVASVPILSLLPVPALQIKESKFSFSANITDITRKQGKSAVATAAAGETKPRSPLLSLLQPIRHEFLTKPVASSGSKDKEVKGTFHLDIEITVGQADLPLGMEKVFNLMDQAIQDKKAPPSG